MRRPQWGGRTSSSRRAANWAARGSVLVGLLAAAILPVAVALAEVRDLYDLRYAAGAVPVAFAAGVTAVILARRGRIRRERTIGRVGGRATGAVGKTLGVLGILAALAGAIAAGTYLLLERFAN